jgi:hypothetical protein
MKNGHRERDGQASSFAGRTIDIGVLQVGFRNNYVEIIVSLLIRTLRRESRGFKT